MSAPTTREALLELAAAVEVPDVGLCTKLSRASIEVGDYDGAYAWLSRAASGTGPFASWAAASALLPRLEAMAKPPARRAVRVALAASHTTAQFAPLLRLAALRRGISIELFEADFGAYAQAVLDPASALHEFEPDYVILAPHEGAVGFPVLADDPERALQDELARWKALWDAVGRYCDARVIQHNIALRPDTSWGHLSRRVPGSRDEMLRVFNGRLAQAADDNVLLLDCDRIAGDFGKRRWFDDRYWHVAKQAVALDALPELAHHTAALMAAAEGLTSKAVVLDLDNTLWGGVIGEDGLAGIRLGHGPDGEAYVAFQEYLLALRARGILLAVVSKNDDADARKPFEQHSDMRLSISDVDVFLANWEEKATNVRRVASELGIGLDSLVFIDDNPAERQLIRQLLPQVEVIALPSTPSDYVRALSDSLLFEAASLTTEDLQRTAQYRARTSAHAMVRAPGSLEDFYLSLGMTAVIAPFDALDLARLVQLIGKTNQFNLTGRRHTHADVRRFMSDDRFVTFSLRLRDRFADHGLVAALVGEQRDDVLDIDTWLMSCRVIGRTVEAAMLSHLCQLARERGCRRVRGTFVPTERNGLVRDLFERLGFDHESDRSDGTTWIYDLETKEPRMNEYIATLVQGPLVGV